jgi:hypothetical protein
VGVVVVLALGGCGGSASPVPSASASPSPSAAASPSASPSASVAPSGAPSASPTTVPSPPADADERTASGVQAFARYFFDVVNHAYATGSTATLKKLSSKDCKTCANWLANIDAVYGAGGRIRGSQVRVVSSSAAAPGETALVNVETVVSEQVELDAKGKTVKTYPEEKGLLVLTLERVDAGWQVREVRLGGLG